jgi:hypothetical protein
MRPSDSELEARIQACLSSPTGTLAAAAESCVRTLGLYAEARPADGDVPVVLIDVRDAPHDCAYGSSFIAFQAGQPWQIESMARLLPGHEPGRRLISSAPPLNGQYSDHRSGARTITENGTATLGVVYGLGECGSGPSEGYMLLELGATSLRLLWNATGDQRTSFGHTIIDFKGDGLGQLRIAGDSWSRQDGQRRLFGESNAGPHRYFEQTWVRAGGTYELREEHVLPSPYKTLVEFVYRLSTGDRDGAAALVADAALVGTAISLGVVQAPLGQEWVASFDTTAICCGPIFIEKPAVKVSFEAQGAEWLISGITGESQQSPAHS